MRSFLLIFSLVCSGVTAADSDANRYALVIGNAAYEGEAALANPTNDANDMAEALSAIGWTVTKVIDADRREMNKAIDGFHDTLSGTRNPVALLFYAGHGIQVAGQNYLIPVKETFETASDVTHDAVSLQAILESFDDAKVSTNIVIMDACRDNPFAKRISRSLGGTRGLSVVSKSNSVEGSAILFSTAPGETAQDGTGRNGVFTQALLEFIKSDMPLQLLTGRVAGEVRKLTGGKQVPYSSLSLSDDFYMVAASLRTSPHPAAEQTGPAVAPGVAAPGPSSDAPSVRASLVAQKQVLIKQKQSIHTRSDWVGWMGWGGWATSAVGAGLVGIGWLTSSSALAAYNSSTSQSGYDSARSQMNTANTCLDIGLGLGAVGLTAGILSLFLAPDTSKINSQLRDIDQTITLLGTP